MFEMTSFLRSYPSPTHTHRMQSVMMPEDGSAGGPAGSKSAGGIKTKMADATDDDKLNLQGSTSMRRTTNDVINELKINIEKIINSNLWQGQLGPAMRRGGLRMHARLSRFTTTDLHAI